MQFSFDNKGNIICGGFYSDKGTTTMKGAYFFTIDFTTKAIVKKSFKEFGVEFLTQNLTEREKEKVEKKLEKGKEVEEYAYKLDDLILREDGGLVLVGEQAYSVTTTHYSSSGMSYKETRYYYNDIVVVNISPEGEIEWGTKIPKRQMTTNDGGYFSSYLMVVLKDKLYFIFNDCPKNLNVQKEGKYCFFNAFNESVAVLVELDGAGNYSKE
jgi:hypothetical protein